MKIEIKNNQRKIAINKKKLVHLAKWILKLKGVPRAELSIVLVSKKRIRNLNKKFRKVDRPTDVLAFSMREGKGAHLHADILGDVVICPEIARESAKIYKTTKQYEINLYLIHGILHLLGYDDVRRESRLRMEKEQLRLKKIIAKDAKTKYYSKF